VVTDDLSFKQAFLPAVFIAVYQEYQSGYRYCKAIEDLAPVF
jgi:hypothetical protein